MTTSSKNIKLDYLCVTYNNENEIENLVHSTLTSGEMIKKRIVFFDNASSDKTVEKIKYCKKKFSSEVEIELIASKINIGLAAGNNELLKNSRSEYILYINPDITFNKDSIEKIYNKLIQSPEYVVVGPLNQFPNGVPHSSFHRSWTFLHSVIWRFFPKRLVRFVYNKNRVYTEQEVHFVSGACYIVKRQDMCDINGYDPELFLCVEDMADLCERLKKKTGKKILFTPISKINHTVSVSAKQLGTRSFFYNIQGATHYWKKHGRLSGFLFKEITLAYLRIRKINSESFRNVYELYLNYIKTGEKM